MLSDCIVIITCVNYSDFLEKTCPLNKIYFPSENFIVVTSPNDSRTIKCCKENNITCHLFDDYFKHAQFNKSGAIYDAQKVVHEKHPEKWIILLDADIILPTNFEELMQNLDKNALYSLRRKDYILQIDFENKTNAVNYPGKNFMGFMQMYFNKKTYYAPYSPDGTACDCQFCSLFDIKKFLSESDYLTHIGEYGINNYGRISAEWT
jgi:hypothetical protein